jgi:mycothiol synthase
MDDGAVDFEQVEMAELRAPDRAALAALVERSSRANGHPALPEPQKLALVAPEEPPPGWRLVLARRSDELVAVALLSSARNGSSVLHLVVDPELGRAALPGTLESSLLARAVSAAPPDEPIHLWALQAGPTDDDRARAHGFVPERDLLQMRVALPLPRDVVAATSPLVTRPFEPGRDEVAWVETNNRAFAGHPEQGAWTVEQLRSRLAAPWVDLSGFLVADDPDGAGLVGSCWTKVHADVVPVLGEIYVISVDPRHHGHGWGRSLTVAGLESLARRGIDVGMLYTDAGNETAVALYRTLGFRVDHIDRSYRRDPSPGPPEGGDQAVPTPVPMARPTP